MGDRSQAAPPPIALQRIIKAALLRDDNRRIPLKDLIVRDPGQLTAPETPGDVDHACLVDIRHDLRAREPGLQPIGASAMLSAKLVPNAQLKVYPGAPHGLAQTRQDEFNADLLAFIKG